MTDPDTNLDWVEQAWGNDPVPGAEVAVPRAHARDCAVETGTGELPRPVPSPVSLPSRARLWAVQTLVPAVTTLAEKKDSLAQARPPSFAGALRRHHECAAHAAWPAGRLLYGYVHTATVKPAVNYLEWATDSPLSLTIHVLIGVAVWLGLLWGGYL